MEAKGQKRFLLVLLILISLGVMLSSHAFAAITATQSGPTAIKAPSSGSGTGTGVLNDLFGSLFGDFNLGEFYCGSGGGCTGGYHSIIDFILLSILFIGISIFGLSKVFAREGSPSSAGKAVMIAVGISLSIGITVLMAQYGITLANIGPIALILFFVIIGFTFYQIITALGIVWYISGAFTFLLMYSSISAITPQFFEYLRQTAPIVMSLLNVIRAGAILAALYGIWVLFRNTIRGIKGGTGSETMITGGPAAGGAPGGVPARERREEAADLGTAERVDRREVEEERRARVAEQEAERLNRLEENLGRVELNQEVAELSDAQRLSNIMQEAAGVARRLEAERGRRT